MSDIGLFMKQFILRPTQVASIVPSSSDLALAMTAHLPAGGRVVEFGAGTGQMTRAILNRGIRPENLTVFETNPDFCELLRQRFPRVTVHCAGAQSVANCVDAGVGGVISGLPLLSMSAQMQADIMGNAFRVLAPGAGFTQFTYGRHDPLMPSVTSELGLHARRGEWVWTNFPPARIWHYARTQRHTD